MSVAPAPQEMHRAVDEPEVLANLTFGGAVLVQDEVGMLCSPMGMLTCQKFSQQCCMNCMGCCLTVMEETLQAPGLELCVTSMQNCCCPGCVQYAFAYTDGEYKRGVQVDSKPGCCCRKPYWTYSTKDYTVPADEADLGRVGKRAVADMRKKGKSDADIAKLYPKKVILAKTFRKDKRCCCIPASFGLKLADGSSKAIVFKLKNKPVCCGECLACPTCNNCSNGLMKGKFFINLKNPIYGQDNQKVAYVVQTAPLLPTTCCTADVGPTIQMAIHRHPNYSKKLSEDDIHRLSLFMYTVVPSVPGGGHGGPGHWIGKIANLLLMKTGWALGFGQTEVETEYLNIKQVVIGGVGDMGNLVESMKASARKK